MYLVRRQEKQILLWVGADVVQDANLYILFDVYVEILWYGLFLLYQFVIIVCSIFEAIRGHLLKSLK